MGGVETTSPLTVELFLQPASNRHGAVHVEGTARVDGGPVRAFSGWMALLELLEAAVAPAKSDR
jgi:hypothetical protein